MATRSHSGSWIARGVHQTVWTGLLNGDFGDAVTEAMLPIHEVSCAGTFGAGGNVNLQGSNDGVAWSTMKDQGGTTLALGAAVTRLCQDNPLYIRPQVSAGDGTTSLTVTLISQGTP